MSKEIFTINVIRDKASNSTLFVECDGSFVNALFGFLTIPMGGVIHMLDNPYAKDGTPILGCIRHLNKSIGDLNEMYFCTEGTKQSLLKPEFVYEPDMMAFKTDTDGKSGISEYLVKECTFDRPIFVITDDLKVFPHSVSMEYMVSVLGKEAKDATVQVVKITVNKIMDLFIASLSSKTPMSDVFSKRKGESSSKKEFVFDTSKLKDTDKKSAGGALKLTVILQKSTRNFLYARAGNEFVDFLFSFVAIPLGVVDVGGNSPLKGIANLWSSLTDTNLFTYNDMKKKLMESTFANGYLTKNHLLLEKDFSRELLIDSAHFPDGPGIFLKGRPGMFLILDDLTVEPYYMSSVLCNGISTFDIEEFTVSVGKKEAIGILRSAMTSENALTKGLLDPIMKLNVRVDP